MIKLKSKAELYLLSGLSTDIQAEEERIAEILDNSYNSQGYDGGYIAVAESQEDFNIIKSKCVDYTTEPIEIYREVGCCVSLLFLPATEYSISVLAHKDIVPRNIKEHSTKSMFLGKR